MTPKNECLNHINHAIELLEELKEILDDPSPESPQAFLECAIDGQDQIGRAITAAMLPVLRHSQNKIEHDEPELVLHVYRTESGQWAGILMSGEDEIGRCGGCESVESVQDAARESGVIPDRVEIVGDAVAG